MREAPNSDPMHGESSERKSTHTERIRERLAEESLQSTAKQVGRVDGSHAVQNHKKRSFLLFSNDVAQVYLKDK